MEDNRLLAGLCGGQLAAGAAILAAAGGPFWAIAFFGGLAGFGIYHAITGDD